MAHWVEKLFPPKFPIEVADIESRNTNDSIRHTNRTTGKGLLSKANTIGEFDTNEIKNVYERVYRMDQLLKQEESIKLSDQLSDKPVGDDQTTVHVDSDSVSHSRKTTDVDDHCSWNSNDIAELRSVFKEAKRQNVRLKLLIDDRNEGMTKLQSKYEATMIQQEEMRKQLQQATIANERLGIKCSSLESNLKEANNIIKSQLKEIKQLKSMNKETLLSMHKLRLERDNIKLKTKKLELELQNVGIEFQRVKILETGNLKEKYESKITNLLERIFVLTNALDAEKEEHGKTKKGLEHLRRHFSKCNIDASKSMTPSSYSTGEQLGKFKMY